MHQSFVDKRLKDAMDSRLSQSRQSREITETKSFDLSRCFSQYRGCSADQLRALRLSAKLHRVIFHLAVVLEKERLRIVDFSMGTCVLPPIA